MAEFLSEQQGEERDGEETDEGRDEQAVRREFALAVVDFGEVENDRGAGDRREDEDARFQGGVEGEEIDREVTEQREQNQFRKTGEPYDGTGKERAEPHGGQANAEDNHAERSGDTAEQPERVREEAESCPRQTRSDPENEEGKRHGGADGRGVEEQTFQREELPVPR